MNSSGSAVLPLALLLSLHLSCHALSPAKDTFGNECTSNADCAPEKFCNLSIPGPKKCVLRPGVGKKCKPDGGDCLKGLFCLKTPAVPTPECRPRVVFGGRCWVGLKNNCAVKLECIPSGGFGKCGFPVKGPQPRLLLGQKCHYPLQEGCQIPNFFSPPHFISTESQNPEVGFHRPDLPECLAIQGRIECALPGSILRRPGAACNPKKDMCDDELYLRCEPYGKRFVCMQRAT